LPHLKCLTQARTATQPEYQHKYYVDLKPRVFDVQIFESTPDSLGHVDGWGTILVVGMRFGGARTLAQDIIDEISPLAAQLPESGGTDNRVFTSAYVVLDITDPENPPRLLGELTYDPASSVDLAYTTMVPAAVPIKTADDGSDWYLVLGSGPTDITGVSDQTAKAAVFPLSEFDALTPAAFRIPAPTTPPSYSSSVAGSFELSASPNGFVSDAVTVDYDLDALYQADVVYFGTIEGDWGAWDGQMYRWVTLRTSAILGKPGRDDRCGPPGQLGPQHRL
jgi:type IV pilus assembly protein PilY1